MKAALPSEVFGILNVFHLAPGEALCQCVSLVCPKGDSRLDLILPEYIWSNYAGLGALTSCARDEGAVML